MDIAVNQPKTAPPIRLSVIERIFGKAQSIRRNQMLLLLALFAPLIVLFIIIRVIPILVVLGTAFTDLRLQRHQMHFIGLDNFKGLLQDDFFKEGLLNSAKFVLYSVPIEILLGLIIALLLVRKVKLEGFYQTLYFLPYILPMVPASIIW